MSQHLTPKVRRMSRSPNTSWRPTKDTTPTPSLARRATVTTMDRSPSPQAPAATASPGRDTFRRSASLTCLDTLNKTASTAPPPFPAGPKPESIRVVCRFRPVKAHATDGGRDATAAVQYENPADELCSRVTLMGKDGDRRHHFIFDRIFLPICSQETIFQHCGEPVIEKLLQGINCTIFAYGQTGAGKTHTILGPPCENNETRLMMSGPQRGLIPRCMELLFKKVRAMAAHDVSFIIKAHFVEIYMEKVRDLLGDPLQNLFLHEDARGVFVAGVSEHVVYRLEDVLALLVKGTQQKVVTSTKMNEDSNRSHGIFTVTLEQRVRSTMEVRIGRLHMVDLAGSEKVSKTLAEGTQLDEANKINQSLLYLSMVIKSLTSPEGAPSRHVPYMNSKLTRLLQDSLGGNTLTYIVLNCSESLYNMDESLSTLRFGERAKFIRNKPRVNHLPSALELKTKLDAAVKEIERMKGVVEGMVCQGQEMEHWKGVAQTLTAELRAYTTLAEQGTRSLQEENESLRRHHRDQLDRANRAESKAKEGRLTQPLPVPNSQQDGASLAAVHVKLDELLARPLPMTTSQIPVMIETDSKLQSRYDNVVEQLALARAETEEMRQRHEQSMASSLRAAKIHAQKVVLMEEQISNVTTAMAAQHRGSVDRMEEKAAMESEIFRLCSEGRHQQAALTVLTNANERLGEEVKRGKEVVAIRNERIAFLESLLEGGGSPPPPTWSMKGVAPTTFRCIR